MWRGISFTHCSRSKCYCHTLLRTFNQKCKGLKGSMLFHSMICNKMKLCIYSFYRFRVTASEFKSLTLMRSVFFEVSTSHFSVQVKTPNFDMTCRLSCSFFFKFWSANIDLGVRYKHQCFVLLQWDIRVSFLRHMYYCDKFVCCKTKKITGPRSQVFGPRSLVTCLDHGC